MFCVRVLIIIFFHAFPPSSRGRGGGRVRGSGSLLGGVPHPEAQGVLSPEPRSLHPRGNQGLTALQEAPRLPRPGFRHYVYLIRCRTAECLPSKTVENVTK